MMTQNIPLSGERLWDSLMQMAQIGGTAKGGCNRQTLTDVDSEGRKLLQRWAEECGLTCSVDRVGNMLLRREGTDPSRPAIAFGSHLDTQPTGGKFDGVLGVLAGLEVMRALHQADIRTKAPLLLVNFTNEEGARFSPPMMGSGVAMGVFDEDEVLEKTDPSGAVFGAELARIGWAGEADPAALQRVGAYVELHIEQGRVLEDAGLEIGVVTGALAQTWLDVTVTGEDAHAGSVMAGRRDALVVASRLIAGLEDIARETGGDARATVGRLTVEPDSRNVVPSRVWFTVDLRNADPEILARMVMDFRTLCKRVRDVRIDIAPFWTSPHTPFDAQLVADVRKAAQARGYRWCDLLTGIGHDAVYMARRVATAMIFVPCHGGISHNESESITPEWATAGLHVLADTVLEAAG